MTSTELSIKLQPISSRAEDKILCMDIEILSTLLPSFTQHQISKVWLGLHSLKRSDKEIQALHSSLEGLTFDTTQKTLFKLNLAELKRHLMSHQIHVGCYFCFSVTCNQMTHIGRRFALEKDYEYLALVSLENVPDNPLSKFKDFEEFSFLAIPERQSNQQLDFLNVVFLPETVDVYRWYFPSSVIRIGCPHGIDIPLRDTLHKYGGALTFDYILSPVLDSKLAGNTVLDQYPPEVIEHQSSFVCSIPTGFPKLDVFYNISERKKSIKNKIIYHLSNWQLESEQVRTNVGQTLKCLLDNFPNYDILFRPFPRDVGRTELEVQLASLMHYPNLLISTSTSYIDDYADADILITHRSETGQIFSLSSGKPILTLHYTKESASPQETTLGMQLYNRQQLIEQIRIYFQKPGYLIDRINEFRHSYLLNLGHSLDYLIDKFDYILDQKRQQEWHYFPLHSDTNKKLSAKQNMLRCLYEKLDKSTQFVHLSEAAVDIYPNDPEIRLIAAESRARTPDPLTQNHFFEFHHISLQHICRALDLCDNSSLNILSNINSWIKRKGLSMAQALQRYLNSHETRYGSDIDTIIERLYDVDSLDGSTQDRQQITSNVAMENRYSFSFDELLSRVSSEINSVYLYGAGQVAIDFINLNVKMKRFKIEKVFDSDTRKQGSIVHGIEVCDITKGLNEDIPIVICSIEFKREIELMLKEIFSDKVTTITLSKSAGWF